MSIVNTTPSPYQNVATSLEQSRQALAEKRATLNTKASERAGAAKDSAKAAGTFVRNAGTTAWEGTKAAGRGVGSAAVGGALAGATVGFAAAGAVGAVAHGALNIARKGIGFLARGLLKAANALGRASGQTEVTMVPTPAPTNAPAKLTFSQRMFAKMHEKAQAMSARFSNSGTEFKMAGSVGVLGTGANLALASVQGAVAGARLVVAGGYALRSASIAPRQAAAAVAKFSVNEADRGVNAARAASLKAAAAIDARNEKLVVIVPDNA